MQSTLDPYQNENLNLNFNESNFDQFTIVNYIPHMVDNRTNMNILYQNTTPKTFSPRKKRTFPRRLESPKRKNIQSPELEIDFIIDPGAEPSIFNVLTWNEIHSLKPKLPLSKTSINLATAQGTSFTNYGKIQLALLPPRTMEKTKLPIKPFKQFFCIIHYKI